MATVSALACAATAASTRDLREVRRQLARHAARELGGELGMRARVGGEALVPVGFGRGAARRLRVPLGVDLVGQHERLVRPAQRRARQLRPRRRRAPRRAPWRCRRGSARPCRSCVLQHDQRRLVGAARARRRSRASTASTSWPSTRADHVPAVGLEALRRVVDEPGRDLAVDRDAVVVVDARSACSSFHAPASAQASWLMPSIRQPSPRKT